MQEIIANVKCPRCGKGGVLKIPRDKFNERAEGGLMKLALDHGDHVFVVWIDSYGYQRATDVFHALRDTMGEGERSISVSDIINLFGVEMFSKILTAAVSGFRMYIDLDKRYLRFLDYLITYLLREFPNVVHSPDNADVVITLTKAPKSLPGENYFLRVVSEIKDIRDERVQLLKLRLALESIRILSEKVKSFVLSKRKKVSIVELLRKLDIKDVDLLTLAINRSIHHNTELKRFIREKVYVS